MKSLSFRAASGVKRRVFSLLERFQVLNGKNKPGELRSLALLSPEVFTPEFSIEFKKRYPTETATILQDADTNCFVGQESQVPWHQDLVSGHSWDSSAFYADIRYGDRRGVDIKNPWDRSRGHHLVRLGQAYALTHDEKYARSFFLQIRDWIKNNPRGRGVNWVSPMEISIRACNWLLVWDFFKSSASVPAGFETELAHALAHHGLHIKHRLEHGGPASTNHYVSNLVGLAYAGVALGREEWILLAERELECEIKTQTFDDGMSYEASTAYHRLVTEMFFFFGLLSERSPELFSLNDKDYWGRLNSMFEMVIQLSDVHGHVPLIGDNDSGRFHSFLPREDTDMSYLSHWGMGSLDESESAWIFGFNGAKRNMLSIRAPGASGLIPLRQSGQVLVFVAQPNGADGVGHHTHNDKLSFTLSVEGIPFFIDSGTAAYTSDPELRNQFRSTTMHSTLAVDGEEQNRFAEGSLFKLYDDAKTSIVENKINAWAVASHSGYERLREWIRHGRRIEWTNDMWMVEDKLTGRGTHTFGWNFILAEKVSAKALDARKMILTSGPVTLEFWTDALDGKFVIEETQFAPAYRTLRPTKKIIFETKRAVPFTTSFFIKRIYAS